jgi:hypothetical protein
MKGIALLALLFSASGGLHAQGTQASAVPVTLGQSVVALNGPWKFHVGDDPRWADPNFDDSQWETVDLTPTPQTTVREVPIPGFVAGWQARGHQGYAGYAWYRMRVRISEANGPLVVLGPEWFDSAFQVFANGLLVGSFGEFTGPVPKLYEGNPSRFSLGPSEYEREPDGSTLIAFRFYMGSASIAHRVTGGMHGPPRIGLPAAATAVFHMEWEREYRRLASSIAAGLLYFLFALLIAMIFAFSRSEKILLWPLCASIFYVVQSALIFSRNAQWMSEVRLEALIAFANLMGGYLWLLTWCAYFGLQRTRWLFKIILVLGVCNLATLELFNILLRIGRSSRGLLVASSISGLSNGTAVFLVMATIAYLGWKRAESAVSAVLSLITIISIYREGGILKRLRATPLRPQTILSAHVIVKLILTAATLALMFLAGKRYYPVGVHAPLFSFAIALIISTWSILSIGFLIASIVRQFPEPTQHHCRSYSRME